VSELKIAIILGSTRPGRNGKAVADWVLANTSGRGAPLLSLAHEAVSLRAEA
jgi:NAD(P)H-dependent FMN reductase